MDAVAPAVLDEPVWFEPLRSPGWLLPPAGAKVPRVAFSAGAAGPGETLAERAFREGLPMYLAEAVRFSTSARALAVLDDGDADAADVAGSVALTGSGEDRTLTVRFDDPSVGPVTKPAPDDASLGTAIDALPNPVAAALRGVGIRSAWSTVFRPPGAVHAAEYVRGHALCRWLRDPRAYADVPGDSDATAARRTKTDAWFRQLAELGGRSTSALAALPFFAGLAAAHDAGSSAYLSYRLAANGLCTTATDPRDPLFRMSILVFRLLGDPVIADQRTRQLASADDDELARWLTRIRGVEAVRREGHGR